MANTKRKSDQERVFKRKPATGYWDDLDRRVYAIFDEAFSRDWTWADLARFAGVSYWTVWSIGERRTRFPQDHTLFKLMKALNLTNDIIRKQKNLDKERRQSKKLIRS